MEPERLGIYAGFSPSLPFKQKLRLIREAGFGATAIWWEEKNTRIREIRHRAPEMIRSEGLLLDNIHVPYFACRELWCDDRTKRDAAVALHRSWIDDCSAHEIPRMVMHASLGASTPPPGPPGLDSFRRLADHSAELGVTIALENTRDDTYLEFLFEHIEAPLLALCFDTSHDQLYAAEAGVLLHRWGRRLHALHLSDTDGKRDQHWLPGEGIVNFPALQPAWLEGYDGVYMLECVPRVRTEPPCDFLQRARQALLECIGCEISPRA